MGQAKAFNDNIDDLECPTPARHYPVNTNGLWIADGSGLSRSNRATASQLVGVLKRMYTHPSGTLFLQSLAVAGREGSLSKRMRDLNVSVVGKTGSLRGVKALSG